MTRFPLLASLVLATAPVLAQTGTGPLTAEEQQVADAEMIDREGNTLGAIALVETPNGILIQPNLEGLPEGFHGFHIHEIGDCQPPDFQSAGGHFNPDGASHGFLSPTGPHAGDLPNIYIGDDGIFRSDTLTQRIALAEDAENSLLDDDGSAIVIHATLDDYQTDPAGDAGDRIACGVIFRR